MRIFVTTTVDNILNSETQALGSALWQNHRDVELIVTDGCSTEGTPQVMQRGVDRLAVLVSESDGGIFDAIKGTACAGGRAVGLLHSDDLFANWTVLSRINAGFAKPRVGAAFSAVEWCEHGYLALTLRSGRGPDGCRRIRRFMCEV